MKILQKISVVFLLLYWLPINTMAQQNAGVTLLKSERGVVLLYNKNSLHFTIEFAGKDIKPADSEQIFLSVDNRMLQLQVADVIEVIGKEKSKLSNADILTKHRDWERDFLNITLRSQLKVVSEAIKNPAQRDTLFWHFPMPDGMNEQVSEQTFLTTVIGDKILALNYSVNKDDSISNAQKYLQETMNSLKTSDKPILVKKVQEGLRKN